MINIKVDITKINTVLLNIPENNEEFNLSIPYLISSDPFLMLETFREKEIEDAKEKIINNRAILTPSWVNPEATQFLRNLSTKLSHEFN